MSNTHTPVDEFDFFGGQEATQRKQQAEEKKIKTKQFQKLAVFAGAGVLALGAVVGAVNYWHAEQAKKIEENKVLVTQTPQKPIEDLMTRETSVVRDTYAKNHVLISQYANYKDMIQVMKLRTSLENKANQNTGLYKQTMEALDNDKRQVASIFTIAKSGTKDQQEDFLAGSSELSTFTKWRKAVRDNEFVYVGGLLKLNKDLSEELQMLGNTQKAIVDTVTQRVRNKDYDLSAVQENINRGLTHQANDELQAINQARETVANTPQDGQFSNAEAQQARQDISQMRDAAVAQVAQDRKEVEEIITNLSSTTTNPSSTGVANTQSGPSFAHYYMVYSWLNSSPSSSYYGSSFNSPSTAVAKSATPGVTVNRTNPSYTTAPRPTATPMLEAANKQANVGTMYNMKSADSFLSQRMARMAPRPDGQVKSPADLRRMENYRPLPDFQAIKQNVERAKARAELAKSIRQGEIVKMQRAEAARVEAAKQAKAATTNSTTAKTSSKAFSRSSSSSGRSGS